jgi:F0F1-type ATP synthase membrane subunit c/vacuolar-type H+-ATPase subunit K
LCDKKIIINFKNTVWSHRNQSVSLSFLILPVYDPNQYTFFGFMGITAALVFCNLGSAYGCAKAGVGVASVGVLKSELVYKSLLPVIMAGILGIYGLIIAIILQGKGK